MENKISFRESLTISFQPSAYWRIVSQTFGRSFGYLTIFLLLLSAVFSIQYTLAVRESMNKAGKWIRASLPGKLSEILPGEIKIENGQVSTSAEEPFIRRWDFEEEGEQKEFAFIIDTTGQVRNLDDYQQGLLLTGNKVISKGIQPRGAVQIKEQDLSNIKSLILRRGDEEKGEIAVFSLEEKTFPVTYENIKKWQRIISWLTPLIIGPLLIYYLIAKLIHLFFFSLVSLIVNEQTRAGLKYPNLLNIGIYALIPPTVLALLAQLAGEPIPYFHLLYVLVYLTFLVMGIKRVKETRNAERGMPNETNE